MIYEYLCSACDHRFERDQKMNDPDPCDCPACKVSGNVTRQIPKSTSFTLKGGGWASSGYASAAK